jgi:hypothetical protein
LTFPTGRVPDEFAESIELPTENPPVASILVSTVPASTAVVWDTPAGIPTVPLLVSVFFTNNLNPLVNKVTDALTVKVS